MMENDARRQTARPRGKSGRSGNNRTAHRRGQTKGKISCHGGKLAKGAMEHPRRRGFAGKEPTLPSWQAPMTKDRRGNWAVNQMPINVAPREFEGSRRLPEASGAQPPRTTFRGSLLLGAH
jgi:hypothetical protein